MLNAAIVGVGFMGWIHYLAYQRAQGVRLAAFCSRNPKKRGGDWTDIRGNFGPPGGKVDVSGLRVYTTLDEILHDESIDLVDVCLPPHLHVDAACRALAAGKHVLCEKPLALNTSDCDRILDAAAQADRRVLVAQVLPYMGEYQYLYRVALQQALGKARHAMFKRIISPPDWIPNFYNPQEVGGPLIDLHVHDTHFVRLLFGMPQRVMCTAEMHDGVVKFCYGLMEFDSPGQRVATASGVSEQTARPFCHGFEVQFEQGVVQFELDALVDGVDTLGLKVLRQDGRIDRPALDASDEIDAFARELSDAARSIRSGTVEPRLDGHNARDAIHICQCLQQAAETGQWVACRAPQDN
ncbi:MAG: oxidoreductase [Pirellulaceae bacterium]|nr:MAG: oxidoreductase [Pirellulaceae bacterium]